MNTYPKLLKNIISKYDLEQNLPETDKGIVFFDTILKNLSDFNIPGNDLQSVLEYICKTASEAWKHLKSANKDIKKLIRTRIHILLFIMFDKVYSENLKKTLINNLCLIEANYNKIERECNKDRNIIRDNKVMCVTDSKKINLSDSNGPLHLLKTLQFLEGGTCAKPRVQSQTPLSRSLSRLTISKPSPKSNMDTLYNNKKELRQQVNRIKTELANIEISLEVAESELEIESLKTEKSALYRSLENIKHELSKLQ